MLLAETSLKEGTNTFHHYLLLEKENITNHYSILTNKGLSQIASLEFEWTATLESPASKAALSTKTSCNDRNVSCLSCPVRQPLATGNYWTPEMCEWGD